METATSHHRLLPVPRSKIPSTFSPNSPNRIPDHHLRKPGLMTSHRSLQRRRSRRPTLRPPPLQSLRQQRRTVQKGRLRPTKPTRLTRPTRPIRPTQPKHHRPGRQMAQEVRKRAARKWPRTLVKAVPPAPQEQRRSLSQLLLRISQQQSRRNPPRPRQPPRRRASPYPRRRHPRERHKRPSRQQLHEELPLRSHPLLLRRSDRRRFSHRQLALSNQRSNRRLVPSSFPRV